MLAWYKKKTVKLLLTLLVLFSAIAIFAIIDPGFHFIDLGLPYNLENKLVILFSLASVCLIIFDLHKLK